MNRMQRINKILLQNFTEFKIEIKDNSHLHTGHNDFDGKDYTHILIFLIPINKFKIDRLKIHRKVNDLLKEEFNSGLHSIEIRIN